jgi:hypothetical protein
MDNTILKTIIEERIEDQCEHCKPLPQAILK